MGTGSLVRGFDTVVLTVRAPRMGEHDAFSLPYAERVSPHLTVYAMPQHRYLRLTATPAALMGLDNRHPTPWNALPEVVDVVLEMAQAESPELDNALTRACGLDFDSVRVKEVHGVVQAEGLDIPATLGRAYERLHFRQDEKPALIGRPYETLNVLRRSGKRVQRKGSGRVYERAYDKGRELGDPEFNGLRVEVPVSDYYCRKADGEPAAIAAMVEARVDHRGWFAVLPPEPSS